MWEEKQLLRLFCKIILIEKIIVKFFRYMFQYGKKIIYNNDI